MLPLEENRRLVDDLGLVAVALEALELESGNQVIPGLAAVRDRLTRSISSYLIPRVSGDEVPLTVVFAGPTGSGKSTLVNTLAGMDISETGPLRPTTRGPLVMSSSQHASAFEQISGVVCEVVVGGAPILSDVALVDTPDIDSTSAQNRATAEILIDNADIVVFVTSVLRYSDLVPWEVLRRAVSRGAPVIHVLNRITPSSAAAVTDFGARLRNQGLESDIIRVAEHHVAANIHHVPSIAVRELQRRIVGLVADIDTTRQGILERVMNSTAREVMTLADGLETAVEGFGEHEQKTRTSFRRAVGHLELASLFDGLPTTDLPDSPMRRPGWRWRNRVGRDRWEMVRSRGARRLAALVEADLRRLAAGDKRSLEAEVVAEARTMTGRAAAIWLEELFDVAASNRIVGRRLGALVLADASVRGQRTPAFDHLFDDPSLLSRARASLEGHIEPIYDSTARSIFESVNGLPFDKRDAKRLRMAASSLIVRSHFADA